MRRISQLVIIFLLVLFSGCAKNPVTGRQELQLISTQKEIQMGEKNYLYGQQASGGKYKLDPELSSYVNEVGQRLAKVSDRNQLPFEFVVINDSIPNAWAMPGGKIVVNRGLLIELNNEAELAAVLGHEITHATARHGAKDMERQMAMAVGLIAANVALEINRDPNDNYTTPALMAGAEVATQLASKQYSRNAELEADHYGMDYMVRAGYSPMAAVALQETFVKLSKDKSTNWLKGLFATHPPSEARVKANLAYASSLPEGKLNREIYQQKIANLKKRKPSYDAYDAGVKALQKNKLDEALTYANKALALEENEALFYGLKGDIFSKQKEEGKALTAYNQAIERDSDYYHYYLQRGLTFKKMHQFSSAKQDLQRSQSLLPTTVAENALKQIG